ncbi:MAG: AMIN domain-containing protein, partial [Thermodesulfovibrionales bacterium]|nr:AMIN domain-containing protein [Thermodesulfovibrionales bacterium]
MKQKLIKNIGALVILIFALGCATGGGKQGAVQGAQNPVLTALDITDNKLNIVVDKPFTYTIYKSSDPYKVIVELPDVRMGFAPTKIKSDKAGITEITPSQTEDPVSTKLEILLSSPVTVEPVYKDTTLVLKVKEEPEAKGAEITSEAPKAEEKVQEVSAPAGKVEEPVKWAEVAQPQPEQKAIPAAESKEESAVVGAEQKAIMAAAVKENNKTAKPEQKTTVARDLPSATSIVKVTVEKEQDVLKLIIKGNGSLNHKVFELDRRTALDMHRIGLDIPNVTLEALLPKAQAPLKGIRSGKYKDKTRIVLDMKEKTSFSVTAIADSVIVAFQLPEKEKYAAKAEKPVSMETKTEGAMPEKPSPSALGGANVVSFDFQDADIASMVRILSLTEISGYNFVIDPDVPKDKKITLKLMNVPWEQALDTILQSFRLGKSIEGNILWIAPITTFTKMAEEKTKAKDVEEKASQALSPLERKTYRLMFAN